MLDYLHNLLALSNSELAIAATVVLLASIARGFSGFALSALIMAGLSSIIAPIMLIPVCLLLEAVASIVLLKGGLEHANQRVVWGLAIGSTIGMPIGLLATISLSPEISRTVALLLILLLAGLQLSQRTPAILTTRHGLYLAGLLAGIAAGLASIGGMVIALYILAQRFPVAQMRASLVMFLFISMITAGIWLAVTGLLDTLAILRALALAPIVLAGVYFGACLFRPSLEHFYKRFCLYLLIALASFGLLRVIIAA